MNVTKFLCTIALVISSAAAVSAQAKILDDWKLVDFKFGQMDRFPIEGMNVTLTVDTIGLTISGNSGCNRYTGTFKFEDSGSLAVGPIIGTGSVCQEGAERFERKFREVLKSADSFSFEGGALTVTDVDTMSFLRFKRVIKPVLLTWYVNREVVDCVGVVKTKCLQIKDKRDGDWQNFYGPIDGFEFKKGFYFIIELERVRREDPAADQPPYFHRLLRIIRQTKKEKDL
jgi:heat shock protein HslJ